MRLLADYATTLVLDVGANVGLYGKRLRDMGYRGNIIAFEPLTSAYAQLVKNVAGDHSWKALKVALGSEDVDQTINIAANLDSSSILGMLPAHLEAAPHSQYVGQERITVRRLDTVIEGLYSHNDSIYLKIDTQGYEKHVIEGAEKTLAHIGTIQVEMSLTPLYQGGPLLDEMCELLHNKGYSLVSIEPGFSDKKTGRLLQVDGTFHRF
jgi:FkbM family methyltransferase